ncbi:MAG TPA: hypothetical protein EYH58_04195 [Aquifex aeolicus]|nr:hypothetical protein [Aquifex aeolicus]
MELFEILKKKKEKISVEIEAQEKLLTPFSTLKVKFKEGNKILYEVQTILKCENLEGCFVCFNKDLTMLSVEKARNRLNFPLSWKGCLTWQGKPVFEDKFFESIKVKEGYFYGYRKNYTLIERIQKLEVFRSGNVIRLVLNGNEFFTEI